MSIAAPATTAPIPKSKVLGSHLGALRSRIVAQEFIRRLALALAFAIVFLGLEMLADFYVEFSLETRRILLIAGGAVFAVLLIRAFASLSTARRDDETLALMVEKSHPAFDSRLIASVQFANGHAALPPDAAIPMIERTVTQAEEEAKNIRFAAAADPLPLRRSLIAFTLIALIGAGAIYAARDIFPALAARAFLSDQAVPRDTRILTVTGDLRIGAGDPVELEATASGILPDTARLEIKYASGRRQSISMGRDTEFAEEGQARYVTAFEEVPESFTYRIFANDGRSPRHEVKAIERPRIENLAGDQVYPEFTGLDPSPHLPGGFNLFPGSQFTLNAKANKGLAGGTLRLIGQEAEIPLDVDPSDPTNASAQFTVPAESLSGFTITLNGDEGMESDDRTVYRVQLLTDNPPQVRITYPRRAEELATGRARFLVKFEATDRFGIRRADINFRRDNGPVETVEIALPGERPTSVELAYDWIFTEITPPLVDGTILEYWISAQDLNDLAPGIGESEHLTAKIVSAAEKRADLLGRASDAIGVVGESTTDQERLNNDLGETIREKSGAHRPEPEEGIEDKLLPPPSGS